LIVEKGVHDERDTDRAPNCRRDTRHTTNHTVD
jgi:hypothetical protein